MAQISSGLVFSGCALLIFLFAFPSPAMPAVQPQPNERARYLNPNTGRFWSMDTDEGDNEDPISLHKYLYCLANPVDRVDPSGHDGDLVSLETSIGLGAEIDALGADAVVGAETSAEGTAFGAEATEVTETAVAGGETTAAAEEEVAKTTLRAVGKTVRGLIEDAKKLLNKAKDSPIKVIPMPRSIIQKVANNIAAYQIEHPLTGFELVRCSEAQRDRNRIRAEAAYLAKPIRGLPKAGENLDEYPFASSTAGGGGARVAPVPAWQNAVQGGIISACYRIEGIIPDDPATAYTVVVIP